MTTSSSAPADARVGAVVAAGQYRVLARLGEGGFGAVYLVETVVGGLRRALKVLHSHWAADARSRARFINEALVLEQMNHPNIARCYSAGTLSDADQVPYLLLEYVDGVPLDAAIRDGAGRTAAMAPLRAVRLAQQIASGLVALHANQVLHRDLTPQNVLIVAAGTPDERVKLVDFGIADEVDDRTRSGITAIGTPDCCISTFAILSAHCPIVACSCAVSDDAISQCRERACSAR